MANARALDNRRKSVKNIKKITRTMELIATARFKQAMDRLGFLTGGLCKTLCRSSCRSGQNALLSFCSKDFQQATNEGGLTHPGSTGDDKHFSHHRLSNGRLLLRGQLDAEGFLNPRNRLLNINLGLR